MTPSFERTAIIGAGMGGSLAAWHLARAGRPVELFEKESKAHHKVCGEFISAEGVPYLEEMGFDFDRLGASVIDRFRLHGPKRSAEAPLPRPARGFSRYRLDELMVERAAEAGAVVHRGEMIKALGMLPSGEFKLTSQIRDFEAATVVCATGKAEFKSVQARSGRDSGMIGYKIHLKLAPKARQRLERHIDLFVFADGYGGLSAIEDGQANLCLLFEARAASQIGLDWQRLASFLSDRNQALREYLDEAQPVQQRPLTVARVPYGFVHSASADPGLYCIGDQLAVIPSLTGDGMTIALMSARRAALRILTEGASGASTFHEEMSRVLGPQVGFGYYFHRLFKSPTACDWATLLIRAWPGLVGHIFERTRSPELSRVRVPRRLLPEGA